VLALDFKLNSASASQLRIVLDTLGCNGRWHPGTKQWYSPVAHEAPSCNTLPKQSGENSWAWKTWENKQQGNQSLI